MKKLLLLASPMLILLASCTSLRYAGIVCTVKPVPGQEQISQSNFGNSLIFEDENCKIKYLLWGEGGISTFHITNKTSEVLTVDLTHSFITSEDLTKDVYQSRQWTTKTDYMDITVTEQPKITVYPGTTKEVTGRTILAKNPLPKDSYSLYRLKVDEVYNEKNSPIEFSSTISYSLASAPEQEHLMTHKFYVANCYDEHTTAYYISSFPAYLKSKNPDNDNKYYWASGSFYY